MPKPKKPKTKQVLIFSIKVVTDCDETLDEADAVRWMRHLLAGCDVGEATVTGFRFGQTFNGD